MLTPQSLQRYLRTAWSQQIRSFGSFGYFANNRKIGVVFEFFGIFGREGKKQLVIFTAV